MTSPEGVLAVRRRDKKPLWAFLSGELEPGETPAQAGIRETKEETGLDVVPGRILGRRVHPHTGRQMIYLTARHAKARRGAFYSHPGARRMTSLPARPGRSL